jgi:hypothetical protein
VAVQVEYGMQANDHDPVRVLCDIQVVRATNHVLRIIRRLGCAPLFETWVVAMGCLRMLIKRLLNHLQHTWKFPNIGGTPQKTTKIMGFNSKMD